MNLNAQWIVGFVDGEGCFYIGINKQPGMITGYQVLPELTVVQHKRDVQVLYALKTYFGCGVVRKNHDGRISWRVRGIDHLLEKIIPFFMKHPLKTKKNVEFRKFRKVLLMMKDKKHLTKEGIEEIKQIAKQMDRGAQDKVRP